MLRETREIILISCVKGGCGHIVESQGQGWGRWRGFFSRFNIYVLNNLQISSHEP